MRGAHCRIWVEAGGGRRRQGQEAGAHRLEICEIMAVNASQAVLLLLEGLSEVGHLHSAAPVPVECIEDRLEQEDVRLDVPGPESVGSVGGWGWVPRLGCAKSRAQGALCFRRCVLILRQASPGPRSLLLLDPSIAFLRCKDTVGS